MEKLILTPKCECEGRVPQSILAQIDYFLGKWESRLFGHTHKMHEQEALASIQYQLSQLRHKIVNSLALTDPEHQAVALEREFAVCEKFLKATEDQWQRFDIPNGYR